MSHSTNTNLLHTPKRTLPYTNSGIWHYYSPGRSYRLCNEGMSKMSHSSTINLLHIPKRTLPQANSSIWHYYSPVGHIDYAMRAWVKCRIHPTPIWFIPPRERYLMPIQVFDIIIHQAGHIDSSMKAWVKCCILTTPMRRWVETRRGELTTFH